jgi:hypothetical protein
MNLFKRFLQYVKEQSCKEHYFVDSSGKFVDCFERADCSCIHCGLIEFKQSLMLKFQQDQFEFQKQLFKSALEKKFHNRTDELTTHINEEIEAFLNEKHN